MTIWRYDDEAVAAACSMRRLQSKPCYRMRPVDRTADTTGGGYLRQVDTPLRQLFSLWDGEIMERCAGRKEHAVFNR